MKRIKSISEFKIFKILYNVKVVSVSDDGALIYLESEWKEYAYRES